MPFVNYYDAYCNKYGKTKMQYREEVRSRKEIYSYTEKPDWQENRRKCSECGNLKIIGIDNTIYEYVLQCFQTKEIYGSFYCRDDLTTCFCSCFSRTYGGLDVCYLLDNYLWSF